MILFNITPNQIHIGRSISWLSHENLYHIQSHIYSWEQRSQQDAILPLFILHFSTSLLTGFCTHIQKRTLIISYVPSKNETNQQHISRQLNTHWSQFVVMEIGMPIWTPHLVGRALAASSLMFWNLLAAALTHLQASLLSVVVGVKSFKFWTPLQQGAAGLPPPVRQGMQGASEVSTCPQVTAQPGCTMTATVATTTITAMTTPPFIFVSSSSSVKCQLVRSITSACGGDGKGGCRLFIGGRCGKHPKG